MLLQMTEVHPFDGYVLFPGSSTGKESTCKAGDLGSIAGLESSPREDYDSSIIVA